jgi:hypothetical protein
MSLALDVDLHSDLGFDFDLAVAPSSCPMWSGHSCPLALTTRHTLETTRPSAERLSYQLLGGAAVSPLR